MEYNEILANEEIMEATEEVATTGVNKGLKVMVSIGLIAFGSVIAYKRVIKPLMTVIKARKARSAKKVGSEDLEYDEIGELSDTN